MHGHWEQNRTGERNGTEWNGTELNGTKQNLMERNRMELNGTEQNGMERNRTDRTENITKQKQKLKPQTNNQLDALCIHLHCILTTIIILI